MTLKLTESAQSGGQAHDVNVTPSPNNVDYNHVNIDLIAGKLEKFLRDNEHNEDLKYVLNMQRGGSESTVLHDIGHSSAGIKYDAFSDDLDSVEMLLCAGANPNIKNSNGETPLETAIQSKCYHITELLLNEEQKELKKELGNLLEHADFWTRSRKYEKYTEYYTDDKNVDEIREFLERHEGNKDLKFILNLQTGQFGSTVLHDIVKYDVAVVDLLLKAGADPDIQDTEGKTPMHYAAEYGCSESIDILVLGNKANPNIIDEQGNTPLHYAIANGDTHSAESLVKAGTTNVNVVHQDTGETPIFDAVEAERDSGRIAELMITDEKVDLSVKNAKGMSVLHKAALCGRSSTVDLLLHKINPFDLDHAKRSPLHFAALNNLSIENNSSDESRENGFDYRTIETPDANITAIIGSLVGECMQIINIKLDRDGVKDPGLREKKLDCAREEYINAKDKNGNTPLFYAAESGKINVVNRLLDEGAKIDVINKEGFTSLHFAVKNRSLNLLKALLHEVKVNDKEGAHIQEIVAPIHIAAKYGSQSQIKFFIDKKADLNLRCAKLSSSTIGGIGKEREFSGDSLDTYTNIQDGNLDASEDGRGWSPLHIAIKRVLEENCGETERKKMLKIVKDLASVSDLAFLIMPEGIDEWSTWRSGEIIQILQDEIESRKGTKLPNAPIENKEARAPIFDDSFYSEIGSHVTEPDLFSDLSGEPKKSCKFEVWDEVGDRSRSILPSGELKVGAFELPQSQKEKLDKFLLKISEASSMTKLAEIVDQALKSGVTINYAGRNHQTFTSAIVDKVGSLEIGKKEGDEVVASMICKLISKGGYISDTDKFWGLEYVYRDYNKDIAKAETEFKEYYNNLKKAAEEAVNEEGSVEELKIDNTTFYIKYSESSLVNIAKITEEAKKLRFKEGNITFSQNIVKIGDSEVSVEVKDGIRNYADLSDNSDITLTFSTGLGELKVRLRPDTNNRGRVTVEVFDQEKFNRLKDSGEKIGENCRLGGLSVYEAIDQGGFHNLSDKNSKKTAEETNAVSAMDWVIKTPNQNSNSEVPTNDAKEQAHSGEIEKEPDSARATDWGKKDFNEGQNWPGNLPSQELNSLSTEKVVDKKGVALGG